MIGCARLGLASIRRGTACRGLPFFRRRPLSRSSFALVSLLLLFRLSDAAVAAPAAGLEQLLRERLDSAELALARSETVFAESEFREVLAVASLQLGAAHLSLQEYAEAETSYRVAAAAVGTAEEAALADALADFRGRLLTQARSKLEELSVQAPDNRPARLLLAKLDFLLGDGKAARAELRQVYGDEPDDLNAVFLLALIEAKEGRPRAATLFQKIRAAFGDSVHWRTLFARAYRESGDTKSALAEIETAFRLAPDFEPAREELERIRLNQDGDASRGRPEPVPSLLETGRVWPAEAIQPLVSLLSVYETLADLAKKGLSRAQIAAPSEDPVPQPNSVEAQLRSSRSALARGELASALSSAEQARARAPNSETVLLNFARVSQASGKVGEAIATYRRLLLMNPDLPDHWLGLGSALTRNLELPEALRVFQRYMKLEPDDDQGFVLAGYVQYLLGDLEAASINLNRALALNPDRLEALQYLALVSYHRGDFDGALKLCQQLLGKDPARGETVLLVGKIFRQKGELERALARLRDATKLIPDSPEAHYELSRTLLSLGRGDEAAEEMKRYRSLRERGERVQPRD